LTTGSDNNASTRDRASAISYFHDGPLRWSPDQRAGVRRRRGQRGNKPSRGGGVGDAPWWCAGRFGDSASAGDDPNRELCPLLRKGRRLGRPTDGETGTHQPHCNKELFDHARESIAAGMGPETFRAHRGSSSR